MILGIFAEPTTLISSIHLSEKEVRTRSENLRTDSLGRLLQITLKVWQQIEREWIIDIRPSEEDRLLDFAFELFRFERLGLSIFGVVPFLCCEFNRKGRAGGGEEREE